MSQLSHEELWAAITALPRPSREVPFPRVWTEDLPEGHPGHGKAGEPMATIYMTVLTHAEQQAALANAERTAREVLKDQAPKRGEENLGYENIFNNSAAVEVLFRACKCEDRISPFFKGTKDVHARLTVDEIGMLQAQYHLTQEQLGPMTSRMSAGDVDAWLDRLEKAGAEASPLAFLSLGALSELVTHLVRRLRPSSTDTSFPGSPQDAPTSETEPSNEEETIA